MATTFFLRTRRKSGYAPVCVRVQSSTLGINIRQSTNMKVSIQKWNLSRASFSFRDFLNTPEGRRLFRKIEEIRLTIDERIVTGRGVTAEQVRKIVHDIVYRECLQDDAKVMTLGRFVDVYLEQAANGSRKTRKGSDFSKGTVKSISSVRNLLLEFNKVSGKTYDFDDVDFEFRTKFLDFLYNTKGYNINTAAKCLNIMSTILAVAESEGYHSNHKCLAKNFKAKRKDVDNVYLTKEELRALMSVNVSKLPRRYEVARDIFFVGIYTAQRVSDYNNINPGNIILGEDGSVMIKLRQKKTGVQVSIPAKEQLKQILKKYDYNLPRVAEKSLNKCIKELAKMAGIDDPVTVESTTGGAVSFETKPKYELVCSHTARRTAATLMYLAGMDVFNICSVTGHSSIAMLKKYIKADDLDRARLIRSDEAFAKW